MRRTLRERLAAPFGPETVIRTSPDHPAIALTSKGNIVVRVANLGEQAQIDLSHPHSAVSKGVKLEIVKDAVEIRFPESSTVPILQILADSDREIIERVAVGTPVQGGWDTGKRFSATLSTGAVAVRVPLTDTPGFETYGQKVLRVEDSGVMVLPPNLPVPEAAEAANAADATRLHREARWRVESDLARTTSFISVQGDRLRFDLPDGFDDIRYRLLLKGATDDKGDLVMDKETFLDSSIHIRDLRTDHSATISRIAAAEAQARARLAADLARKGIDASRDPDWVARTPDGDAVFSVPGRATALLSLLTEAGAQRLPSVQTATATMRMAPDAFAKILPLTPMIGREIAAVSRGLPGDAASMESRVRYEARAAGKDKVNSAITAARQSWTKGAVSVSSTPDPLLDPLNPLNPVGIFQMHLWAAEEERAGAAEQAKSMSAKVQDTGGEMTVEPMRGEAWAPSSDSHSSSYSGGYSTPSSSYESSSSSYDSSSSSTSFD